MFVYILIVLLLLERAVELVIARKNERWVLAQGGKEYGAGFSKVIVLFHISWFAAFQVEAIIRQASQLMPVAAIVFAFLVLQAGRYWCIASLGKFWNTKVLVLPGAQLIRNGPYRRLKHPNYVIVVIEVFLYPALFGCWWTACVGSVVNFILLRTRIVQEEKALAVNTDYKMVFKNDSRTKGNMAAGS